MQEFRNDQIEQFMEAIELEMIQSRLDTMECCLCKIATLSRAVGFLPGKPARPFIFAICEVCQLQPEWMNEADKVMSPFINEALENEKDQSDYGDLY
jgi:hypothetical protein